MSSSITFSFVLPPSPSGRAYKLLRDGACAIASVITGLDSIRMRCRVIPGQPSTLEVTICEERIPQHWTQDAEPFIAQGFMQSVKWTGEFAPEQTQEGKSPTPGWCIVPEETGEYHVEFVCDSEMGKMKAWTKWDGCTHLYLDVGTEDECYHHICDLDYFIDLLKSVREKSRRYFDGEFSVCGLNAEERVRMIEAFQREEQTG